MLKNELNLLSMIKDFLKCGIMKNILEMGDIIIGHLILSKAKLKVVREVPGGEYRLILVREDKAASVCFERRFPSQVIYECFRKH